jgi:DNA mismatch repair ATPase MutS
MLAGRDMGTGNRVPLARVPYHAVDNYLARLIQAGHGRCRRILLCRLAEEIG